MKYADLLQSRETVKEELFNTPLTKSASMKPQGHSRQSTLSQPAPGQQTSARCYRCGGTTHDTGACRVEDTQCHHCGKTGHLQCVSVRRQEKVGGIQTYKVDLRDSLSSSDEDE
ncbi:hypothetical protein FKM82_031360 [Ascaphus truei]